MGIFGRFTERIIGAATKPQESLEEKREKLSQVDRRIRLYRDTALDRTLTRRLGDDTDMPSREEYAELVGKIRPKLAKEIVALENSGKQKESLRNS